jgi:hypothetical protein
MAKKKAKVKSKLHAMAHSQVVEGTGGIPSAKTGQIGPDLIGANIGLGQQISAAEQSQMIDKMREKAKQKKNSGYPSGQVPLDTRGKSPVQPDGTFKNADGDLVIGDLKKFQASQGMRKKKKVVKKKA